MKQPYNPANALITYTLNFQQVNLLLEGLGKLPFERVEPLYTAIRGHAVKTLHDEETAWRVWALA